MYLEFRDYDETLLRRPAEDRKDIEETVSRIISDVRERGDAALRMYGEAFDSLSPDTPLFVTEREIDASEKLVPDDLKAAIDHAIGNIRAFHEAQMPEGECLETEKGVLCWRKIVPVSRVGLYVPGGTAPLFSTVLMLAVPASVAGCREIILATPSKTGAVSPAVLYAAKRSGVSCILRIGGAQAIAALAFGTESVPRCGKIFGPGNAYVTEAKRQVSAYTAIDMPAGPSEVAVLADETANPAYVASDLLSQAEHGVDSQAILITTSEDIIDKVKNEVEKQLAVLPRKEITEKSLSHSKLILVNSIDEAIEMSNEYAPEHLIIETKDYMQVAERIVNAGSVFLGPYTPESAGDYASGTNHTLPTNGYAKAYSGVNLDSFMRKITFQEITREGIMNIGPTIETMAANEFLDAHKNAVSVRLK